MDPLDGLHLGIQALGPGALGAGFSSSVLHLRSFLSIVSLDSLSLHLSLSESDPLPPSPPPISPSLPPSVRAELSGAASERTLKIEEAATPLRLEVTSCARSKSATKHACKVAAGIPVAGCARPQPARCCQTSDAARQTRASAEREKPSNEQARVQSNDTRPTDPAGSGRSRWRAQGHRACVAADSADRQSVPCMQSSG